MLRRELTDRELARRLHADVAKVRGLLSGAVEIDNELAVRLAKSVGGSALFWMKRQSVYNAALARIADTVPSDDAIAWLKKFPQKEIADFGWIEKPLRRSNSIKSYLAYFGVSSPKEWEKRYAKFVTDVAFRTSPTFESKIGPLSAWLRQGEIQATATRTAKWNRSLLIDRLPELRRLSKQKSLSSFVRQLRSICASAGVAVVFIRAPSGCRASGATRFIEPSKAMIVQSFRHLSDDHFWFTFFHEIGHLVLHGHEATFVDSKRSSECSLEAEANEFAANVLIPLQRHDELVSLRPRMESIVRFAVSIGIAPGIVVGQMQHLRVIGPHQLNFLKRQYDWSEIAAALN
jgi:plasmid maintenance system antidote protein VapI